MTVCPIAIVASCRRCPAFSMCPLKTVLGDHRPQEEAPPREGTGDGEPPRSGEG